MCVLCCVCLNVCLHVYMQVFVRVRVRVSVCLSHHTHAHAHSLNLASFVTTYMEPECNQLMMEAMNVNYIGARARARSRRRYDAAAFRADGTHMPACMCSIT